MIHAPPSARRALARLAILQDVPHLGTPDAIAAALERWRHCLSPSAARALETWLAASGVHKVARDATGSSFTTQKRNRPRKPVTAAAHRNAIPTSTKLVAVDTAILAVMHARRCRGRSPA